MPDTPDRSGRVAVVTGVGDGIDRHVAVATAIVIG